MGWGLVLCLFFVLSSLPDIGKIGGIPSFDQLISDLPLFALLSSPGALILTGLSFTNFTPSSSSSSSEASEWFPKWSDRDYERLIAPGLEQYYKWEREMQGLIIRLGSQEERYQDS